MNAAIMFFITLVIGFVVGFVIGRMSAFKESFIMLDGVLEKLKRND
jgi:uncharacterized membrane-anchored protein YhcB (DUF1043 family)